MSGRTITPVRVKNVTIGDGTPTIIVPITGRTPAELHTQVAALPDIVDIVEWRMDFFHALTDTASLVAQARALAEQLDGIPLLATCRTRHEGGEADLTDAAYADLNVAVAESGSVDLVDTVPKATVEDVRRAIAIARPWTGSSRSRTRGRSLWWPRTTTSPAPRRRRRSSRDCSRCRTWAPTSAKSR